MMKSLANIKVANDDGITNKICRACRQQLQEAYDFKILIERSDAALKGNLNKLKFDNINDIKMEIEINLVDKKPKKEIIDVLNNIDDDDTNKVCYGETAITKFRNDKPQFALKYHEQDDVCLKPVPVLEFLKSIPDETDNDNYSDVDKTRSKTKHKTRSGKTYGQDTNNDEFNLDNNFDDVDTDCEGVFISPEKLLKKKRIRRKFPPQKEHQVCIKPVMLKGLKLTYASGSSSKTKATISKPIKKAKTVCPYCGVMTTYLHKHIQIHEGVRKYKCDKCEKAFFTSDSLKNHRKNIHGAKQLKCPECIMTFTCKMNLKSHMFKHSDKMSFVCDVCTKAFKRRHALRRHILMHNAANKKVPCEYCDMTFYTKYQLNHHLRIHTRERPYNCEVGTSKQELVPISKL
ncbi:zinc-finger associated domain (zf-AD) domain-containing protein [Phthorimaea operculella]|nr:zinc-finger associated domain (zf-AD) domain-containing protein [Phthorimaea operculella]